MIEKHDKPTTAKNTILSSIDDSWIQRLCDWADEFELPDEVFPRDKAKLLAMRELTLSRFDKFEQNGEKVDNPYKDLPEITYLPAEIGQLIQLQKLILDNNSISELPPEIRQLNQLQRFELSWNNPQHVTT